MILSCLARNVNFILANGIKPMFVCDVTFGEIDREISTVILPLPPIQEGQLSVTENVCAHSTG